MEAQIAHLEAELQKAQAQISKLKESNSSQNNKIDDLKKKVDSGKQDIVRIKESVESIKQLCSRLEERNQQLKEQQSSSAPKTDQTEKYVELRDQLDKMKLDQAKSETDDKSLVLIHEAISRYKKRITQLRAKADNIEEGKDSTGKSSEKSENSEKASDSDMAKLFVDLPKTPNLQLVFRKQQSPEQ